MEGPRSPTAGLWVAVIAADPCPLFPEAGLDRLGWADACGADQVTGGQRLAFGWNTGEVCSFANPHPVPGTFPHLELSLLDFPFP